MTDLILILIGITNLFGQWYWHQPQKPMSHNMPRPAVTPTDPRFVNEYAANQENSAIVEPKSPQLLQFEEEEALRKLNLKPQ